MGANVGQVHRAGTGVSFFAVMTIVKRPLLLVRDSSAGFSKSHCRQFPPAVNGAKTSHLHVGAARTVGVTTRGPAGSDWWQVRQSPPAVNGENISHEHTITETSLIVVAIVAAISWWCLCSAVGQVPEHSRQSPPMVTGA